MERATLARPYAEAVSKLAAAGSAWSSWSERLSLLARVVDDAQLRELAGNPGIAKESIVGVVLAVCGDKLGVEGANLARLLVENKRLSLLPEIVIQFEVLKASQEGELTAHITTAYTLSDGQMEGLVSRLEARFARKVNATQSTDAELIGGVVIQVGVDVMDSSVRGGLQCLAVVLHA